LYVEVLTWGIHREWLRKITIKHVVVVVGAINGIGSKVLQGMKHPVKLCRIVPMAYKIRSISPFGIFSTVPFFEN
jgi:hypothetical protein